MAAFDPDADLSEDLGLRLMINSFITLYWRRSLLDEAVGRLREDGYRVVELDAGRWAAAADMHRDIAAALEFPDYYGKNLDALNDCLRDVESYEYGTTRDATGLVLAFTGYDRFRRAEPDAAQSLLDILADRARSAALFGHRILCLVQSDDPDIEFEPVGAMPVDWNDAEWSDAKRRG
ncbi:Barstar (barnase inhibitor) [Streptomyces davaonensis JCM 4913]|uniref:Barstar (Barnase inhibitor) n=1 Tax=Streptomyces davaonensis (strain DSM 101723 / JCM 4913 / KCC S-0913 / 768) TaxID=1214101 RepID=K4R0I9_STRDJ|nr:barstar family protein [Streptomyces davaonensis]CCK26682.1 Barstar (barnase inhibitor) [Streptomyces davaonensis JCM 4913]